MVKGVVYIIANSVCGRMIFMVFQGSDNIYRTIIVGAGSSSANFIPEFCRVQSENVRVTFMDHDLDQIERL